MTRTPDPASLEDQLYGRAALIQTYATIPTAAAALAVFWLLGRGDAAMLGSLAVVVASAILVGRYIWRITRPAAGKPANLSQHPAETITRLLIDPLFQLAVGILWLGSERPEQKFMLGSLSGAFIGSHIVLLVQRMLRTSHDLHAYDASRADAGDKRTPHGGMSR